MSAALSRLRALLKDELFIRGPNGLQPTARALDLSEPLGRALAEIQRTLDFTQDFEPSVSTVTFTLGLSDHPTFVLLPRLIEALNRLAPNVSLRVRHFSARNDAITMLDAGEADVVIGVPATPTGRILTAPLFEERFVSIVRRGHPASHRPLDLEAFLELPHLLVSPENDRFGHVDVVLAKRGLTRRLALTLPNMYAAPLLIARSDMIATVMGGVVEASGHAPDLAILEPPIELAPVPFILHWHRRNDLHPAQRWLRECITGLYPTEVG